MKASDIDLQVDPTPTVVPTDPITGIPTGDIKIEYPDNTGTFNITGIDLPPPSHAPHPELIAAIDAVSSKLDHTLEHLHKIDLKINLLDKKLSGGLELKPKVVIG